MATTWRTQTLDALSARELYAIFQLRLEVFSVEQNAAYQDADGKDLQSFHISGFNEQGDLIAYARILPGGIAYDEVSIGRVVTSPKVRGTGAGRQLFTKALEFVVKKYGDVPVRISAQSYLIKFYQSFGFETVGDEYLEDSLPHTEMLRKGNQLHN